MPAANGTHFHHQSYGPDHGHHSVFPLPPGMECGWQPNGTDFTMNHLIEEGMYRFTPSFSLDYNGAVPAQMFTMTIRDYEFQHELWYDGLGKDTGNTHGVKYRTRIGHEGRVLEEMHPYTNGTHFSDFQESHDTDMHNCSVRVRTWKMNLVQLLELDAEIWDDADYDYIVVDLPMEISVKAKSHVLHQPLERTVATAKQKIKIDRITEVITCDINVSEQRQAVLHRIDYDHDNEDGQVCFTIAFQNQHWIQQSSYDYLIANPNDHGYHDNIFTSAGYRTEPAKNSGLLNNETSQCSFKDDQTCQTTFDLCFHKSCSQQFELHHEKLTWEEASNYCRHHPDFEYLGSPRTQSEMDQIEGVIDYALKSENGPDGRIDQKVWVGLNKRNMADKWGWDDPSKACIHDGPYDPDMNDCSDNWAPAHPLNDSHRDCAAINAETTKFENGQVCNAKNPVICSRDHEHHIHLGGVWKFAVPVKCRYDDVEGHRLCESTFNSAGFVRKPNGWYQLFHVHVNEFNLDCNIQMDKQHVKITHQIENYGRDYHHGANPIHSKKFETYDLLKYKGQLHNIADIEVLSVKPLLVYFCDAIANKWCTDHGIPKVYRLIENGIVNPAYETESVNFMLIDCMPMYPEKDSICFQLNVPVLTKNHGRIEVHYYIQYAHNRRRRRYLLSDTQKVESANGLIQSSLDFEAQGMETASTTSATSNNENEITSAANKAFTSIATIIIATAALCLF